MAFGKKITLHFFFFSIFFGAPHLLATEYAKVSKKSDSTEIVLQKETYLDANNLAAILSNASTYQARFEQSVYRENSDQPEVTSGQFLIQRPDQFLWQTVHPFEQTIIANGKLVWIYDLDLEQVTIQEQQSVLADSPLLLLTSPVESLVAAFDISEVQAVEKNQRLFALLPKDNGMFENVYILIEDQKVKEFFLKDSLGGRTSVKFDQIQLNQIIDKGKFIFVPPEGIDIIDSREIPEQ